MPAARAGDKGVSPATTRRTTAKKTQAKIADFDAARKKTAKPDKKFQMRAFGKVWTLKRPNQMVISTVVEDDSLTSVTDYVLAHVVPAEREAFIVAASAEEDFDLQDVQTLAQTMEEVVYADIPQPPS